MRSKLWENLEWKIESLPLPTYNDNGRLVVTSVHCHPRPWTITASTCHPLNYRLYILLIIFDKKKRKIQFLQPSQNILIRRLNPTVFCNPNPLPCSWPKQKQEANMDFENSSVQDQFDQISPPWAQLSMKYLILHNPHPEEVIMHLFLNCTGALCCSFSCPKTSSLNS